MLTLIAILLPILIGACIVLLIGCAFEVRKDRQPPLDDAPSFTTFDPIAHHSRGCRCIGHR